MWIRLPKDCNAKSAFKALTSPRHQVAAPPDPTAGLEPFGLSPPSALISVTGAADTTISDLSPKEQEIFRHGLREVARISKAWIITGGTESGVMKLVGDLVGEATDKGLKTVCLGVAPWDVVREREALASEPLCRYEKQPELALAVPKASGATSGGEAKPNPTVKPLGKPASKTVDLDPNHSHFLLVEGGGFGSEITLRTQLEEYLARRVPSMLVCVGGGKGTLETIYKSLETNRPCVVLADSGGVAAALYRYFEGKDENDEAVKPDDRLPPKLSAVEAEKQGRSKSILNEAIRTMLPRLNALFERQQAAHDKAASTLRKEQQSRRQRMGSSGSVGAAAAAAADASANGLGVGRYVRPLRFFKSSSGAAVAGKLEATPTSLHLVLLDALLAGRPPAAAMTCAVSWGDVGLLERYVAHMCEETKYGSAEVSQPARQPATSFTAIFLSALLLAEHSRAPRPPPRPPPPTLVPPPSVCPQVREALLAGFERALVETVMSDDSEAAVKLVRSMLGATSDRELPGPHPSLSHTSPHLPKSPRISPHLRISPSFQPHLQPHLCASPPSRHDGRR